MVNRKTDGGGNISQNGIVKNCTYVNNISVSYYLLLLFFKKRSEKTF